MFIKAATFHFESIPSQLEEIMFHNLNSWQSRRSRVLPLLVTPLSRAVLRNAACAISILENIKMKIMVQLKYIVGYSFS